MLGGTCPTHTSFSHGPFDTTRLHYLWLSHHSSSAAPLARGLGWGWWRATTCPAFALASIFPTMKPLAHEGTSFVPIISPSLVSGYSSECRDFLVADVQVESHAFA